MLELVSFLGYLLLKRLLLMLVVVGGIAFAIVRWQRHPRVSLMTVIALGFYLVESWLATIFFHYLPDMLRNISPASRSTLYTIIYFVEDFAFAAVLILLVAMAFTGRRQAANNAEGTTTK